MNPFSRAVETEPARELFLPVFVDHVRIFAKAGDGGTRGLKLPS